MSIKVFGTNRLRTFLESASTGRIDIAWIVNSHGLQGGHGYEQGFIDSLVAEGFQMYASGWMSALAGDGATGYGSGEGWQGASSAAVATAVLSTVKIATVGQNGGNWTALIPADLLKHCNQFSVPNTRTGTVGYSPVWPLYWDTGTLNCQQGAYITGTTPLGDATNQYVFHATVGRYGVGGGSTTMRVRRQDTPFTAVADQAVNFATGTQGDVADISIAVAADAGRSGYAGLSMLFGIPFVTGPAMIYGSRIERPDRTTGFSVHMTYSAGGRSARDMYNWATTIPDETWDFLMDRWTELQGGTKASRKLVVMVSEAHNQQSETLVHAAAPNQGDADAPENFAFYMGGIISIVRQAWLDWGGDPDNIVFGVNANHPRNDGGEAELITYRNALMPACASSDVAYIAMERIRSLATMVSAGDFSGDNLHLTGAAHPSTTNGYYRVMLAMVQAIRAQTTGTPQTAARSYAAPGPIKLYRFIPNGTGEFSADHPVWDNPSIVPIIAPLFDEDDDMADRVSKTIEAAIACDAQGRSMGITLRNLCRSQYSPYGPMGRGLDGGLSDPWTPDPIDASFYCNAGIANASAFVEGFCTILRNEWTLNGFQEPDLFLEENEDYWGVADGAGNFTPAVLVGDSSIGVYTPSLNDARASDPEYPVYFDAATNGPGTMDMLEAARVASGITYDDSETQFGTVNTPFFNWFATKGVYLWIMQECFYRHFRACFPTATLISYDAVYAPGPAEDGSATAGNYLHRNNPRYISSNEDYFPVDASNPSLYGFDRAVHDAAGPLSLLAGTSDSEHWRSFNATNRSALRSFSPSTPVIAFLLAEGSVTPGATYEPSIEDNAWYMRMAHITYGDSRFILFQDTDNTGNEDDHALELIGASVTQVEQHLRPWRRSLNYRLARR